MKKDAHKLDTLNAKFKITWRFYERNLTFLRLLNWKYKNVKVQKV